MVYGEKIEIERTSTGFIIRRRMGAVACSTLSVAVGEVLEFFGADDVDRERREEEEYDPRFVVTREIICVKCGRNGKRLCGIGQTLDYTDRLCPNCKESWS